MFSLTRSRRLSRRSRAVSAVIGIAAVLWVVWMFVFESQLPPVEKVVVLAPSARPSFARLAEDEEIVVTLSAYRRTPTELRFRRSGAQTHAIISEVTWSATDRAWKMTRVLRVRPLSAAEAAGLDAVVAHLRGREAPGVSHPVRCEIEYRRVESSVGREELWESLLVMRWNDQRHAPGDDPEATREFDTQASREGVARAELERWVTFEQLLDDNADEDAR